MSRFSVGQRVQFRSTASSKMWRATIRSKSKVEGFWFVDDGTGLTPRHIHENFLGMVSWPKPQ